MSAPGALAGRGIRSLSEGGRDMPFCRVWGNTRSRKGEIRSLRSLSFRTSRGSVAFRGRAGRTTTVNRIKCESYFLYSISLPRRGRSRIYSSFQSAESWIATARPEGSLAHPQSALGIHRTAVLAAVSVGK